MITIIAIHIFLLGAAALLRCADGGIGIFTGAERSALYTAIHGDTSLSGRAFPMEKIGLKQSYEYPRVERFMNCVNDPSQACAGITTRLLNSAGESDIAIKRMIFNVLDSAPIALRKYAMEKIGSRDEYGAINIDMDLFKHIVDAMKGQFIIEQKPNKYNEIGWAMTRQMPPDAAWFCNTMDGFKFTAMLIAMQLVPSIIARSVPK